MKWWHWLGLALLVVALIAAFSSGRLEVAGAIAALVGGGVVASRRKAPVEVEAEVVPLDRVRRNAGQIAEEVEKAARGAGANADAEKAGRDADAKTDKDLSDEEFARRSNARHGARDPEDGPGGTAA